MKNIYFFGNGNADGSVEDKNILGGKGANLAEMTNLGIPVPPGFTISTDICTQYMETKKYPFNQSCLRVSNKTLNSHFGTISLFSNSLKII